MSVGDMFEFRQHARNYMAATDEGERMPEYLRNGDDLELDLTGIDSGERNYRDDLEVNLIDLPTASIQPRSPAPAIRVPALNLANCLSSQEGSLNAPR